MAPDRHGLADGNAIQRRYGPGAAREWQLLLNHFALSEGFALLVLIVPDRDGADLCRDELARVLARDGRHLATIEPATPGEMRQLASDVLNRSPAATTGAVWVAAVVSPGADDYADWASAWQWALANLNQHRNPLRRRFPCPLLMVGAPWLVPLFRENAPDLWSVRTQVVRIEPDRDPLREERPDLRQPSFARPEPLARAGQSSDPTMALQEAARLRGMPGRELDLAVMLERAGYGYFGRDELAAAEANFREATDLRLRCDRPAAAGTALHNLARAVLDQGRAAEAEDLFRRALALKEQGGDTAVSQGITLHELARAVRDQGRAAEAEDLFRRALALLEQDGDTAIYVAMRQAEALDLLARSLRNQGRTAEAAALLRGE